MSTSNPSTGERSLPRCSSPTLPLVGRTSSVFYRAWGAPEGVRGGHASDQSLDLGMDGRATSGRAARELAPVLAKAAPLPPQDGHGGNDHEGLPPPGPASSQPDPEEAIRRAQLGSGRRSFVHGQLLPQGKVLDSELAVATEEEREESKQVEQEGDHRAEILSGSAPTDQRLAAGRGFGEGQVLGAPFRNVAAHSLLD